MQREKWSQLTQSTLPVVNVLAGDEGAMVGGGRDGYIPPLQGLVLDFRKLLVTERVGLLQARLEILLHLADILLLLVNAFGGVGRGTVVNGLHGGEVTRCRP